MRVTIKMIAEKAGVSRGTVDRVLNGRARVRPEIREKVRLIAAELDYRPNRAGRALATIRKTSLIGIIMPPADINFFDDIQAGLSAAESDFHDFGIRLAYHRVNNRDPGQAVMALHHLIDSGARGILYAAMDDLDVVTAINQAINCGIPVITFNSDVPSSQRLCFVGQDLVQSGRIAADLMRKMLPDSVPVLPVTGSLHFQAHRDRILGFIEKNKALNPPFKLLPVIETYDRYEDTYSLIRQNLLTNPDLQGIYMATGHIGACLDAIRPLTTASRIRLICNDRTPEVIAGLQEDMIDFTILQDPFTQGYQALKLLLMAIFTGEMPAREHYATECRISLKEQLKHRLPGP